MAKGAFAREQFDRNRAFVVTREFTVSGCVLGPGEPFNKGLVTDRRLRQLYEQRFLAVSNDGSGASVSYAKPRAIGEARMHNVPLRPSEEPKKGGFLNMGLPVVPPHQEKGAEGADIDALPVPEPLVTAQPEAQQPELPELPASAVAQPQQPEAPKPNTDGRPDFDSMPREELAAWLEQHGVIPRKGWGHARLAFLASREWEQQKRASAKE